MIDRAVNAEVLDRMRADGDDLTRPRDVDFVQVFPDEAAARAFAADLRREGLHARIGDGDGPAEGLAWDVEAVVRMAPDLDAVTAMQARLDAMARRHGGRGDGWGAFALPPEPG